MGRALSIGLGNSKTGYACNCCLNPESPVIYAGEYVKVSPLGSRVAEGHSTTLLPLLTGDRISFWLRG